MFENIIKFFKKIGKHEVKETNSKEKAKERLHLVLMQDRANVSADFLEMMKQEIIDVIKKYIEVEENSIDVRLTNEIKEDGTTGAPSLYANIPILHIRNEMKKEVESENKEKIKSEEKIETDKVNKPEKSKPEENSLSENNIEVKEKATEDKEINEEENKTKEKEAQETEKEEETQEIKKEEDSSTNN